MSSLSSSNDINEVYAAYDDNASYAEDGSASKAHAFITACRILIRRQPKQHGQGTSSMTLSPELLRDEINRANEWLAINDDSVVNAGVVHHGFQEFRT
ncbi:MAG: hypothetical protein KAY37_00960 [Phycisphaerae bacterium]|nr:hypothetical protein [Phycisphaerae bacterium]